jgi:S1-C subfamily serine protease
MTRALGLPEGVPLVQVTPGGPAHQAGLRPFARGSAGGIVAGDVVTAIDDIQVADLDDMLSALERFQPGDTVTLSLWREGQTRKQAVKLGTTDE